jgi:5-aminopentanamidase
MTDAVVAIAQAPSVPGRLADNAEQAARLISASAEAGASIAILPELFLSGYDVRGILDNPYRHVVTEGDPICTVVQRACARHEIAAIVGGAVALTDGIANAALVIAPDGTLVHVYRKVHLWGEEAQAFVAGTQPTLVDLAGLRIGMSICFDAGFPEHVRALTLAGADLIACPAAFAVGEERQRYDLYYPTRALENTIYVAVSNAVGEQGGLEMFGDSGIFGPRGNRICRIGSNLGVETARLDQGEIEQARKDLPYLRDLAGGGATEPEIIEWRW